MSCDTQKKQFVQTRILHAMLYLLCILMLSACGAVKGADEGDGRERARIGKLTITLPEEFGAATSSGLYICKDDPDDRSNIYLYTTKKDDDFAQLLQNGREQFVSYLADSYEQQYGERPEIIVKRYEAVTVGRYGAYVIEVSYDLDGVHYEQLEYIVDGDRTYYAAFSQVGEHDWMESFAQSAATMIFEEDTE